ncbi:MAG: pyridoxamine 5'-phosphate oxidase family protein [Candidatus Riflebacteria bacterium]|nr:pyridoxamine 5'-phosphate oxidase family protein [Candidatus Riflebacteria bacterium]
MNAIYMWKALKLANKVGHVMVATASAQGTPHIASALRITAIGGGRLAVQEWFCPGTVSNLEENRKVAIVVWEASTDQGYQLLGEVERARETAMLNGHDVALEKRHPVAQVQRQLVVLIHSVQSFSLAPHSDLEEWPAEGDPAAAAASSFPVRQLW